MKFTRDPWYVYDGAGRYIGPGWATEWAAERFIEQLRRGHI